MKNIFRKTSNREPILAGDSFTTSFGFQQRLQTPDMKFDVVPVLDLLTLALLISLLFTRYIMLPGMQVSLPKTNLSMQPDDSRVAVLTVGNEGMLFFSGSVYEHSSIEQAFKEYVENDTVKSSVLLMKASDSMELQDFLDLCQMAQDAGFREVQIAADPTEKASTRTYEEAFRQSNPVQLPAR